MLYYKSQYFRKQVNYMTNSVSSNRPEKYNIAAFFSGVGGIELGFEQTNEFRVVYANEFDKYARQTYQLNHPDTYLDGRDISRCSTKGYSS